MKYSIVHFGPPDFSKRQYFVRQSRGKTLFIIGKFDGPLPPKSGDKYKAKLFPGVTSARRKLAKVAKDLGYSHLHGDFYGKGEHRLTLYYDRVFKNPSKRGMLSGREVVKQFNSWWRQRVREVPAYANDLPAKRQAFSVFVDDLNRDGRVSDKVAYSVTLPEKRGSKKVLTNPHKAGSADKVAARELLLFIENDGELYRQQTTAIQKNLTRKFKKGKYSSTKAAKLWGYLADNGAKKYSFEYADSGYGSRGAARSWHQMKGYGIFTAATRRLTARLLEKAWHAEMKAGNFHD